MIRILGCIIETHDLRLVALAAILCAFACWTTMKLLQRAVLGEGVARRSWLWASGVVLGGGVWVTHFVGMLAYRSSLPIGFALAPTLLSIAIAVLVSTGGLGLALNPRSRAAGAALIGLGIAAMHFTGMLALEGPFTISWDAGGVIASIVVGVLFSVLAAWVGTAISNGWGQLGAVSLLTLAVCGLHFTGMTAVTLIPDGRAGFDGALTAPALLAVAIGAIAMLIVALAGISALVDGRLSSRAEEEADRLRAHVAALEATQAELQRTSRQLQIALDEGAAANVAKAQFLAAVSHELRTPLNAVIGFAEMMSKEACGPLGNARYAEYAGDIHNSGVHLLSLINDILDLTRLEAAQVTLMEEAIDVREAMASAVQVTATMAKDGGVEVILKEGPALVLWADRRRLRQILINLLTNAVKFTPANGQVTLDCGIENGAPVIRISDTGIGMAEADIPKALDRFGQIDSRLSRKYEGAGLGLSLCAQLAELHQGQLKIDSEVGVGTTVTILFPPGRLHAERRAA